LDRALWWAVGGDVSDDDKHTDRGQLKFMVRLTATKEPDVA
jgi:hypothetical protein